VDLPEGHLPVGALLDEVDDQIERTGGSQGRAERVITQTNLDE